MTHYAIAVPRIILPHIPVQPHLVAGKRLPWRFSYEGSLRRAWVTHARVHGSANILILLQAHALEDEVEDGGHPERQGLRDEADLVARCLSGDASAFDLLVTAYQSMVYNLAYRQLGDRDEALDLSQEVFLRVYRSLGSFRGDSSLKTWIFRIVVNLSRNRLKWWRSRRRDQTVSLDAPADPTRRDDPEAATGAERLADERQDPERQARNQDLRKLVEQGMALLSVEHRQILVLRDMEDLSYEEIALALGLSGGTVKSRLSRARSQLKEVLSGKI